MTVQGTGDPEEAVLPEADQLLHEAGRRGSGAALASSGPRAGVEPGMTAEIGILVPAHLSFLGIVRETVDVVMARLPCDAACRSDVRLATDELASVLMLAASPWSAFEVKVTHDDSDLYVRMSAHRATPGTDVTVEGPSRTLLSATIESCDVWLEGRQAFAVLQRPLD